MQAFRKALLYLREDIISKETLENDLVSTQYPYKTEKVTLRFYSRFQLDGILYYAVPPYYKDYSDIKDYNQEGTDIDIILNSKFDYRTDDQKYAVENMLQSNSCILKAIPGFGKTYCAIRVICELKKKSMIIVSSEKLRNQWIESILKFTNLTENQIGIISGKQSINDKLKDKPIVIAMIQTLSSITRDTLLNKEYLQIFKELDFGITFIDELHKILGTPFFSRAFAYTFTRRSYGLSATPRKNDKTLSRILRYYYKDFVNPEVNKKQPIRLIKVKFKSDIPFKTFKYITFSGMFDINKYLKQLIKYDTTYRDVLKYVIQIAVNKNKNLLILGHTHALLNYIKDIMVNELKINGDDIGFVIHNSKEEELTKRHILSTYKMSTEGLSINHSNMLIFASPIGKNPVSIEQAIGRVTRDHTKDDKAVVIDLLDQAHPSLVKWGISRSKIYEELNLNDIHEIER